MTGAKPDTNAANRMAPGPMPASERRSRDKGDVPLQLLDRYLIERDRQGRPERYYRDHKTRDFAFMDHGRALSAPNAYPDSVAAMLRIARHRGWSHVKVKGDETFRREVWVQGRTAGVEVSGYKPTERDLQAADGASTKRARSDAPAASKTRSEETVKRRLDMAAVVVRTLISDPAAQARLMQRAWAQVRQQEDRARDRTDPARNARAERRRER